MIITNCFKSSSTSNIIYNISQDSQPPPTEEKYPDIEYNPDDDEDPGPDPNFFYDLEQLYARAKTDGGPDGVPANFLTLFHSFGYECLKRCNLHVLDEKNVLFSAGNYIQILNLETKKLTYLPTIGGRGIGSIAVSFLKPSLNFYQIINF